jgi:hypothetical protein
LIAPIEMVIDDLLPRNSFLGVSLILPQDGRFLFGIRPPKHFAGVPVLEITGIGGKVEAFDASLTDGAQREAREEISTDIQIIPCTRILVVRGYHDAKEMTLSGDELPAALVFRQHHTPPHQPWIDPDIETGCIAVFLARLEGQPSPSREIPYLIWLKPEQILAAAQSDVSLGQLLDTGAELKYHPEEQPALSTSTRLTDSQEALALALGIRTLDFYQALV